MRHAISAALILLMTTTISHALEAHLYAGIRIPPGWADGFKYSPESSALCSRMVSSIPDTAPSKPMVKCIVKLDPNAAPMY